MYVPEAFNVETLRDLHDLMRATPLANLVLATKDGLAATPLPFLLEPGEGEFGTLYGHVAKANPIWHSERHCPALAIFMGPDAYITPSWYATKQDTGKVVPTWNYVAVHVQGAVDVITDEDLLLGIVTRLTQTHEAGRVAPWAVSDAPEDYVRKQLSAIVGVRMTITSIEGKQKMSQNRPASDRAGVAEGLAASERQSDRAVSALIDRERSAR